MIKDLLMYSVTKEHDETFILGAVIEDEKLTLLGQDCCALAEEFYGEKVHDYAICFNKAQTKKIFASLGGKEPLVELRDKLFSDAYENRHLYDFCIEKGIRFKKFM